MPVAPLLQKISTAETHVERLAVVKAFIAREPFPEQFTRQDAKQLAEAWCSFPRLIPLIDLSVYACRMSDSDFLVEIERIVSDRLLNLSASPSGKGILETLRNHAEEHASGFFLGILKKILLPSPVNVMRLMRIHYRLAEYEKVYELGSSHQYWKNPAIYQFTTRQQFYLLNHDEEVISNRVESMISIWRDNLSDVPELDLTARKEGKIRVGYFDDLYDDKNYSAVFTPILDLHDLSRFDVHHLAINGYRDGSEARRSDIVWVDLKDLDAQQRIAKIRMLDLDIIYDTWGVVFSDQAQILTRGLAKAQVHGAFNSVTSTDSLYTHILAPENYLSEETAARIKEKVVDLDASSWPCDVLQRRAVDVPPPPRHKNGHLTFGSLSQGYKISSDTLHLWGKIVSSIDDAHFFLGTPRAGDLSQRAKVYSVFAQYGVSPDRISIRPAAGFPDYLRSLEHIDICLATYPVAGGMTVTDYLAHGRPCLTLDAEGIIGRMGRVALQGFDLSELAFRTEAEIIAFAQRLANDTSQLDKLCEDKLSIIVLKEQSDKTNLQYTRALEQAYETIFADFIEPKITKKS